MFACGYKQTLWSAAWSVRFTPKTRHQRRHVCFPLKSRSRLLEAPYSAISGCLAFGDSGGKIALSGLEIGVGAVPFPPILGRQWPSCRAEPDGRPQRSPGFASAHPVPSPRLPQGRAGWSARRARPPDRRGLALPTNTLAWPRARERLTAHQAATGLFLIGVQRFGLLGIGQIHARESTTYRRSQKKPRRNGARQCIREVYVHRALKDLATLAD